MIFKSQSERQTMNFALNFSKNIQRGSTIALIGSLGSGKTVFAKGFAKGLKIKENVGSPTFKIISEYIGIPHNLYHIDSYRLNGASDFLKIGGEEYLNQDKGVTIIEWADLIDDILPEKTILITFERLDRENDRQIKIKKTQNEKINISDRDFI